MNMMRYFDFFGDYFCPSNLDSLLSLFLLIGIELVDFFFFKCKLNLIPNKQFELNCGSVPSKLFKVAT